jgi:hypothetical protein
MNDGKELKRLRVWAERLERTHRSSQAMLVRQMIWEIEQGATWLAQMRALGIETPNA